MTTDLSKKIAIIGAGIAGLNCARMLADVANVTVFEKSNKVGGRMATHVENKIAFDHGAQYFTVKDPIFQAFVDGLIEQQVVARWDARFIEFNQTKIQSQRVWSAEFPHYVGIPSMRSIGESMAKGLDVRLNHQVTNIERLDGKWQLSFLDQETLEDFDWVIVTIPAPQTNDLLAHYRDVDLPNLVMQPCFALMLAYPAPKALAWDAALIAGSCLSWVSVNSAKPKRQDPTRLVVLSNNSWADKHFNMADDFIIDAMMHALTEVAGQDMHDATMIKLKKWRYANTPRLEQALMLVNPTVGLACCGDWCKIGRVESAFMSSYKTALSIKRVLID